MHLCTSTYVLFPKHTTLFCAGCYVPLVNLLQKLPTLALTVSWKTQVNLAGRFTTNFSYTCVQSVDAAFKAVIIMRLMHSVTFVSPYLKFKAGALYYSKTIVKCSTWNVEENTYFMNELIWKSCLFLMKSSQSISRDKN